MMSRLGSDETLAILFKMEPKMIELDQFPRLERYLTEFEPDWLDTFFAHACQRLPVTRMQAVALIDVLRSIPTKYRSRPDAIALLKDCEDLLTGVQPVMH
mgnify:CR=1 FL=1